ncbi:MAG: hypothetical protein F4X26_03755 [Chloroflexi bacterium]|nr:hypothetical protein [Chloroflexota bacterium]
MAASGVAELDLALDRRTTWQDLYDTRTDAERACIHGELGGEATDLLARAIFRDEPTQEWEVSMFSCLEPPAARAVLLDGLVLAIGEDGLELSDTELACAREQVAAVDVPALIAADLDGSPGAEEVYVAIADCLGYLLIELMVADFGLDPDELGTEETACIRAFAERTDWAVLVGAGDATTAVDVMAGVFGCVPELLVMLMAEQMGLDLDALTEDGLACMREWAGDADIESFLDALVAGNIAALATLTAGLTACPLDPAAAPAR